MTATAQTKYHKGLPVVPGFKYAKFNDLDSVKAVVGPNTAAVLLELVQGEGGVNVAEQAFVQGLKALATQHNFLLIFDEVQTGIGRTGALL